MKTSHAVAACLMSGLLSLPAAAQTTQPRPAPTTNRAAATTQSTDIRSRLLPASALTGATLEEIMNQLHEQMPDFNVVVVRPRGVSTAYPNIPKMMANNVTIGQFLDFIVHSFSGIEIRAIESDAQPLYVVQIKAIPSLMDAPGGPHTPEIQRTQVYRLSDIVVELAASNTPEARKQALNDVLSLIQAALAEAGGEPAMFKIHEPTQSLLFKGNAAQTGILTNVINTLTPSPDVKQRQAEASFREQRADLEMQLRAKTAENQVEFQMLRRQLDRLEQMNAQLQAQLQAANARPATAPKE